MIGYVFGPVIELCHNQVRGCLASCQYYFWLGHLWTLLLKLKFDLIRHLLFNNWKIDTRFDDVCLGAAVKNVETGTASRVTAVRIVFRRGALAERKLSHFKLLLTHLFVSESLGRLLRKTDTHLVKLVSVSIDELRTSWLIFKLKDQLRLAALNREDVCFGREITIKSCDTNAF